MKMLIMMPMMMMMMQVKPGGAMASHGLRITLKVTSPDDLKRDLLKVSPFFFQFSLSRLFSAAVFFFLRFASFSPTQIP